MQNPFNPSVGEIREWAYDAEPDEPVVDFHLFLAWARHESTYFELACDRNCPKRLYFLAILYYIVGQAVRTNFSSEPKPIIEGFIARGGEYDDPGVRRWQERSRRLLKDPSSFDYGLWCGGGLVRADEAQHP